MQGPQAGQACLGSDQTAHTAQTTFCVVCDHCDAAVAAIYCHTDECFLCPRCDIDIHTNKISARHNRVPYTACPGWAYSAAFGKGRLREGLLVAAPPPAPQLHAEENSGIWPLPGSAPRFCDGQPAMQQAPHRQEPQLPQYRSLPAAGGTALADLSSACANFCSSGVEPTGCDLSWPMNACHHAHETLHHQQDSPEATGWSTPPMHHSSSFHSNEHAAAGMAWGHVEQPPLVNSLHSTTTILGNPSLEGPDSPQTIPQLLMSQLPQKAAAADSLGQAMAHPKPGLQGGMQVRNGNLAQQALQGLGMPQSQASPSGVTLHPHGSIAAAAALPKQYSAGQQYPQSTLRGQLMRVASAEAQPSARSLPAGGAILAGVGSSTLADAWTNAGGLHRQLLGAGRGLMQPPTLPGLFPSPPCQASAELATRLSLESQSECPRKVSYDGAPTGGVGSLNLPVPGSRGGEGDASLAASHGEQMPPAGGGGNINTPSHQLLAAAAAAVLARQVVDVASRGSSNRAGQGEAGGAEKAGSIAQALPQQLLGMLNALTAKSRALPGISTALSHRLSATVLAAQDPRQPLPGCSALVAAAPASAIEAQARALISGAHRQQQAPTALAPVPPPLPILTHVRRADGSVRELDQERALQLHRYRTKRMARMRAHAESQRKLQMRNDNRKPGTPSNPAAADRSNLRPMRHAQLGSSGSLGLEGTGSFKVGADGLHAGSLGSLDIGEQGLMTSSNYAGLMTQSRIDEHSQFIGASPGTSPHIQFLAQPPVASSGERQTRSMRRAASCTDLPPPSLPSLPVATSPWEQPLQEQGWTADCGSGHLSFGLGDKQYSLPSGDPKQFTLLCPSLGGSLHGGGNFEGSTHAGEQWFGGGSLHGGNLFGNGGQRTQIGGSMHASHLFMEGRHGIHIGGSMHAGGLRGVEGHTKTEAGGSLHSAHMFLEGCNTGPKIGGSLHGRSNRQTHGAGSSLHGGASQHGGSLHGCTNNFSGGLYGSSNLLGNGSLHGINNFGARGRAPSPGVGSSTHYDSMPNSPRDFTPLTKAMAKASNKQCLTVTDQELEAMGVMGVRLPHAKSPPCPSEESAESKGNHSAQLAWLNPQDFPPKGCNEVSSGGTPPPSSSIIHSLTCMELGMGCASMQQLPDSFPRDNCQPMQGGESQGYLGLLQLQQQEVLLCNGLQCRQPGEARWSDARGHMLNQGQGHNSKLMSIAEHVGAMPLLGSGQFNLGTGDSGPPLLGSSPALSIGMSCLNGLDASQNGLVDFWDIPPGSSEHVLQLGGDSDPMLLEPTAPGSPLNYQRGAMADCTSLMDDTSHEMIGGNQRGLDIFADQQVSSMLDALLEGQYVLPGSP